MQQYVSLQQEIKAFQGEDELVRHWTAPWHEHTVAAPMSCSEGNTGPLWQDPRLLRRPPLMDSVSLLQVCINLIKRCLCASCLPSARVIIKVSEWGGKKRGEGRKATSLLGLPVYEAAFMSEEGPCCSSCWIHSCLFAKGGFAVFACWPVAPCP